MQKQQDEEKHSLVYKDLHASGESPEALESIFKFYTFNRISKNTRKLFNKFKVLYEIS